MVLFRMPADSSAPFRSPEGTLSFIRSLYDMRGTQADWELRVSRLIHNWLGASHGGLHYAYTFNSKGFQVEGGVNIVDGNPTWKEIPNLFHKTQTKEQQIETHTVGFSTARNVFQADLWLANAPPQFPDGFGLQTLEKTDTGFRGHHFFAPSERVIQLNKATNEIATMAIAHLNAAQRLRRDLESPNVLETAQLVLETNGKVVHQDGHCNSSLEALKQQAILADSTNHSVFNTPNTALKAWTALVNGQWSLIEHFDTDGKRFLLALENPEPLTTPSKLTAHERAVVACVSLGLSNKATAYRIGLDPATTSRLVTSAARKMGLKDRFEIASALGPLVSGLGL